MWQWEARLNEKDKQSNVGTDRHSAKQPTLSPKIKGCQTLAPNQLDRNLWRRSVQSLWKEKAFILPAHKDTYMAGVSRCRQWETEHRQARQSVERAQCWGLQSCGAGQHAEGGRGAGCRLQRGCLGCSEWEWPPEAHMFRSSAPREWSSLKGLQGLGGMAFQ